jgi:hypothetical protein
MNPGNYQRAKIQGCWRRRWVRAERSAYACFSTLPVEHRACDLHRTRRSTAWTLRLRSLGSDLPPGFPGVPLRVPGVRGEPTGGGPAPCPGRAHAPRTPPTPPRPRGFDGAPSVAPPRLPARPCRPAGASPVHAPGRLRRPTGGGSPPSLPRAAAPQRARRPRPSGAALAPCLALRGSGGGCASWRQPAWAVRISPGGQGTTAPEDDPRCRGLPQRTAPPSTASRWRASRSRDLAGACCSPRRAAYAAQPQRRMGCLDTHMGLPSCLMHPCQDRAAWRTPGRGSARCLARPPCCPQHTPARVERLRGRT